VRQRVAFAAALCVLSMSGCGSTSDPAVPGSAPGGVAVASKDDPAADLYAPFSETVLPADGHASAPLRPRATDPVYTISNPRIDRAGPTPFPRLVLDYERTRDGAMPTNGLGLVVRPAGKPDQTVGIGFLNDRAGTIEVGFQMGFPFASDLPALENCEYYLTLNEQAYGAGFRPTFKVSNSAVVGQVKGGPTRARAWTAEEAGTLRKPAPKWPVPNVGGIGRDTPLAGDTSGSAPSFRYAESGRPLIGLEWNSWDWEGVKCLAHLFPIYDRDMPLNGVMPGVKQEVAKPGYAIGGLTVKAGKLTHALKLTYFRLRDDGTLDPNDRYESEWLGNTTVEGDAETTLGGDGRPVIGITVQGGAVVNALSLVMAR
jgi:hypothetical protein